MKLCIQAPTASIADGVLTGAHEAVFAATGQGQPLIWVSSAVFSPAATASGETNQCIVSGSTVLGSRAHDFRQAVMATHFGSKGCLGDSAEDR